MKLKYSPISNFYKQELVASVVMLFMICKGERYCVDGPNTGDVGIEQGSS